MQGLCDEREWKRGQLYMPLRVATTCRRVSTPLFETMEVLDRDECMARMGIAIGKLEG
jgi:glutamyl-tRNA synthetase